MKTSLIILAVTLLATSALRAQLVNDGASATLANVTNSITGTVTVGTNGSFTLLTLADDALLTNSAHGVIGRNTTTKSNEVQLISASARWLMGNDLFVGSNGAFNRLVVSNGAFLNNNNGLVGNGASGSNNLAVVTGGGSLWTNRTDLTVGVSGRENQLVVSNGARVVSRIGNIGRNSGSSNNLVVVTGSGSVWTNHLDLNVGVNERFNRLVIEAGGRAGGDNGRVGAGVFSDGSEALVTGPGSLWSSRTDLAVGLNSGNNRLVVSNGASVVVGNNGRVGVSGASGGNQVLVTGAGSSWSNQFELYVGEGTAGNRMEVNSGGQVFVNGIGKIGAESGASSNSISISGPGTTLTMASNFFVGSNGPFNSLVVSNGATVVVRGDFEVGANSGHSNSVVITDVGTRLIAPLVNTFHHLGKRSSHNSLLVKNGALLDTYYLFQMGSYDVSSNNLAIVTDPGTLWTNGLDLHIGGNGDRLVVSNGAVVKARGLTLVPDRAEVIVTGTGSAVLSASSDPFSGHVNLGESSTFSSSNRLVIEKGALVTGNELSIGPGRFSDGNRVIVTDPGSVLSNQFLVHLSDSDSFGNALVVSNGATVYSGSVIMHGSKYLNGGCDVFVTGSGSTWSNRTLFTVGVSNRSQLIITNGGALFSAGGLLLGEQSNSINNRLVVSSGTLQVRNASGTARYDVRGGTNAFNSGLIEADQLVMTNARGRFEFNAGTFITRGASISNNASFVLGESGLGPASWDVRAGTNDHVLAGHLYVGLNNSSFNQLFITNGALWTNSLSFNVGSGSSNAVTISGPGSRCGVGGGINVAGGDFNRLVVSNGGSIISRGDSSIGALFSGTNNQVQVTGPGSVWNHLGLVQFAGHHNQLLVTDGGLLVCSNAFESFFGTGSNLIVVAGPSTLMNCVETLGVGSGSRGNQLQITNGALVAVGNGVLVGANNTSSGNLVLVNNGTLRITNLTSTGILEVRRGTNVLNAGLIEADILRMTNAGSCKFELNGGTLSIKSSRVSAGNPVIVGNGVNPTTLNLAGNGTHDFTGTLGLIITNHATLTGNGSLLVQLQIRPGAILAPGASIGKISLAPPPSLQGEAVMEISKTGATLTNDQVQVTGTLTYGGTLSVTHPGPGALAAGDRFQLFNATAYAGTFASITLPPLPAPLSWTNKLLVDGSIEVIAPPAIAMSSGTYTQSFDSLSMSGTANPWRDNVTLLGWYAAKVVAPSAITNYIASDGSSLAGALYSFGSTGDGERALGSIGSDSVGDISYGLGFINDTATNVSNFKISFTGEQWRSSSSLNANTLTFWYRVSPAPITNPEPSVTNNWTQVTGLNFVSPVLLGTGVPLNGNQSTNRQTFTTVLIPGLAIAPGESVFFRWHDANDTGTDQGLAVDDLVVSFSPAPTDRFWTNALGGTYHVASNWLAHLPPSPADNANFTNDASYRVTWINDAYGANAYFNARSGIVTQFINQAGWRLTNSYIVGASLGATATVIHVDGELQVENDPDSARLSIGEAGRGAFIMKGGLVSVSRLLATNGTASQFTFSGGQLQTRNTIMNNGDIFIVGDGVSPASLELSGNGPHQFVNGMSVLPNAMLEASGTILGSISMSGTLSPGPGRSQLTIAGHLGLFFGSTTIFELDLEDDEYDSIVGIDQMRYGGTLIVSSFGEHAAGDRFPLFSFSNFVASAFDSVVLPPLPPGLTWKNNLSIDGSIEVIAAGQPGFANISLSGTNVILAGTNGAAGANYAVLTATNVALPLSNWVSIATNQFGAGGQFNFTNPITPGEPQRFFYLRTP